MIQPISISWKNHKTETRNWIKSISSSPTYFSRIYQNDPFSFSGNKICFPSLWEKNNESTDLWTYVSRNSLGSMQSGAQHWLVVSKVWDSGNANLLWCFPLSVTFRCSCLLEMIILAVHFISCHHCPVTQFSRVEESLVNSYRPCVPFVLSAHS